MFCHNPTSQFINWAIFILLFPISAQKTIQQILWNVPDGDLSDLSQTFTAGQTLPLSWNAYDSTQYVDTTKNLVDLWIATFDFNLNPFSQRVTTGVNLTSPGNFAWTIAIPDSNLTVSAKYVLRFKVTSPTFNPNTGDLSSTGFLVLRAAEASSTTSSISSTSARPTSTGTSSSINLPVSSVINTSVLTSAASTATSQTSNSPSSARSSGLSAGAKGGIGAGVALGVLALAGLSYFFFMRRRKPQPETMGSGEGYSSNDYKNGPNVDAGPTEMPAKVLAAELPVNRY